MGCVADDEHTAVAGQVIPSGNDRADLSMVLVLVDDEVVCTHLHEPRYNKGSQGHTQDRVTTSDLH